MCTFGSLVCETPAASGPPGLHKTTREIQTCTFEGFRASNTTKIQRKDQQEREKRMKIVAGEERGKKARNFGPPFGAPPFGAPLLHELCLPTTEDWSGRGGGRDFGLSQTNISEFYWPKSNWPQSNWPQSNGPNSNKHAGLSRIGPSRVRPRVARGSKSKSVWNMWDTHSHPPRFSMRVAMVSWLVPLHCESVERSCAQPSSVGVSPKTLIHPFRSLPKYSGPLWPGSLHTGRTNSDHFQTQTATQINVCSSCLKAQKPLPDVLSDVLSQLVFVQLAGTVWHPGQETREGEELVDACQDL